MSEILSIVGARPQFIKAAPVSNALRLAGHTEFLVHTGQHYDPGMSDIFFSELGIPLPDLNLSVGSGNHGAQTGKMLARLEDAILERKPDWVLVYGDTNSTLAGALAAAKLQMPVAHVEAGLRSFNRRMPEEINRIVADTLAAILFVPSESARQNLLREGIEHERILWTGDVMFDAMLMFRERAIRCSEVLNRLKLKDTPFVLATVHRAENTDDPARLSAIIDGLRIVAERVRVILPLHPRTRKSLDQLGLSACEPLEVIEPIGFLDMIVLESAAEVIATDSGGIQKEAFFHGVPCVTLRTETEWAELLDLGWNRLIPTFCKQEIAKTILTTRGVRGKAAAPYGDGRAAELVADALSFRNL